MNKIIFTILLFTNIILFNYIGKNSNIRAHQITYSNKNLNTKEIDWYIVPNKNNLPPLPNKNAEQIFSKFSSHYIGNIEKKFLYLTFDEGYENGYTEKILDILKKHNVPAAFFVVKPYIKTNKDLILRMVNEGHLVCNHSSHHPSMAKIIDINKFNMEFQEVESEFKKITNTDMPKYFRPPMGKFSEYSLKLTNDLGYKSIFWSLAYKDFDIKNQPSNEKAKNIILSRIHNGAIILLHAVSKTNSEILDEILSTLKYQGYEFRSLTDFWSKIFNIT